MMNVSNSRNTLEAYISYRKNYFDKEPFDENRLIEALKTSIEVLDEVENLIYSTNFLGISFYEKGQSDTKINIKKQYMANHISALQKLTELSNSKPDEE